mgnify:CR=1 FL=1
MAKSSPTIVGANISKLRKAQGISPERFAAGLDKTVQQVFNYERGRTRVSEAVITKAAEILNVPVGDLFKE